MTKKNKNIGRDPNHKMNHHRKAGPHGGARRPTEPELRLLEYLELVEEEGEIVEWNGIPDCPICEELYPEHTPESCPKLNRNEHRVMNIETMKDGDRVKLFPNQHNPLHKSPVIATYSKGYFYVDGSDPLDGPDYYFGDVLKYNDFIEHVSQVSE